MLWWWRNRDVISFPRPINQVTVPLVQPKESVEDCPALIFNGFATAFIAISNIYGWSAHCGHYLQASSCGVSSGGLLAKR
jgi:hypothetical protein